ncbi:nitroreductase family protein [Schumannella soli]|uniref:Nitroreductase n=1 Tax=Schumannella soli TaxID=2590779 RepID=A0A506YA93_9MICO|nr:nitroreductase family protein [Schumannella soli]TPW77379.1 nitroreductase [Schumannella soli]
MSTTEIHPSTVRNAETDAELHPLLDERWSPRSYDESAEIDDAELHALLEAARWAPSAANSQPRRFIAGRRGTPTFDAIHAGLASGNQPWTSKAALLVVGLTAVDPEQGPHRWAEYDLGQSIAHLTVQAHALGLHAHQMGGILPDELKKSFDLPENVVPVTVTAIGRVDVAEELDERFRERETAPRSRKPLDELVIVAE